MLKKLGVVLTLPVFVGLLAAADDKKPEPKYEMRFYVFGMLKRGPKWTAEDTPETRKIQEGHMANIQKMAAMGKLIVAGPMAGDGELRGIFIFDAKSIDEVKAMAEMDPAIQSGRLTLELHKWYAAAGMRVNEPKP